MGAFRWSEIQHKYIQSMGTNKCFHLQQINTDTVEQLTYLSKISCCVWFQIIQQCFLFSFMGESQWELATKFQFLSFDYVIISWQ